MKWLNKIKVGWNPLGHVARPQSCGMKIWKHAGKSMSIRTYSALFVSDQMLAFVCLCLKVCCGNEFRRGMCIWTEVLPCYAMACVWHCLVGCRVDNPSVSTGLRSIPDQRCCSDFSKHGPCSHHCPHIFPASVGLWFVYFLNFSNM